MNHLRKKQQIDSWYEKYSNDVYNYAFFMIGDQEQAKDILQDTFVRAFNNLEHFRGGQEKSWLFRIARNLTIDTVRKKKTLLNYLSFSPYKLSNEKSAEDLAILNETEKQLYLALSKMKASQRDVIILRKIKEFSISETADILGCTEAKVKVDLFRALKVLRAELEKEGYQHEAI
ncbi:RNA polymerase sigma factor SigX [Bacillus sp. THAF10]|uniref:RNA polymerase sigma factor n=1 Tax=Bacillus sp. THAF10 TaxID=2587848 RepID=UPI001267B62A|nr:RNA polymerase sigma factor [Bacillus sp. THAF10]QFT88002.1 RNA polymerase sigma factor SigX [Bacillus sp. THAF10]